MVPSACVVATSARATRASVIGCHPAGASAVVCGAGGAGGAVALLLPAPLPPRDITNEMPPITNSSAAAASATSPSRFFLAGRGPGAGDPADGSGGGGTDPPEGTRRVPGSLAEPTA